MTGIDTATEVQAYYIAQVEKMLSRYEILVEIFGLEQIHQHFSTIDFDILQEFITHGRAVRAEREQAALENRAPHFIRLIREWGGVTIVYRRALEESPAYKRNHEEVEKALEEGIYYAPSLNPVAARVDGAGHVTALVCERGSSDSLSDKDKTVILPARAIFVATGAKPNIAYEFEHRGTFHREGMEYRAYQEDEQGHLHEAGPPSENHVKTAQTPRNT